MYALRLRLDDASTGESRSHRAQKRCSRAVRWSGCSRLGRIRLWHAVGTTCTLHGLQALQTGPYFEFKLRHMLLEA